MVQIGRLVDFRGSPALLTLAAGFYLYEESAGSLKQESETWNPMNYKVNSERLTMLTAAKIHKTGKTLSSSMVILLELGGHRSFVGMPKSFIMRFVFRFECLKFSRMLDVERP